MTVRLTLILVLSAFAYAQRNPVRVNRDMDRAFEGLVDTVERMISDHNRGFRTGHQTDLMTPLQDLREAVERNAGARVDVTTRNTFDLEVDNQVVFGLDPHLPKENKRQGRWTFQPVQFDVLLQNMYVFGVQFGANRTIRLKSVRLVFDDGTSILHNGWWDVDNGNGQMFSKRKDIPMLNAWAVGEKRRAKRLRALEIVGSAQDRGHSARLNFKFRIPDPGQSPYGPALDLIDQLTVRWNRFEVLDANTLNTVLLDLIALAEELRLDYCPRIIAMY